MKKHGLYIVSALLIEENQIKLPVASICDDVYSYPMRQRELPCLFSPGLSERLSFRITRRLTISSVPASPLQHPGYRLGAGSQPCQSSWADFIPLRAVPLPLCCPPRGQVFTEASICPALPLSSVRRLWAVMGGALAPEDRGALGTSLYLIRECGFADGSCAPAVWDE